MAGYGRVVETVALALLAAALVGFSIGPSDDAQLSGTQSAVPELG